MWRPWRSWRPRDSAECGVRNAECQGERRFAIDLPLQFRIPPSALRIRAGGGMKYFVTIGAQTHKVAVAGSRVVVGGAPDDADLSPVPRTPRYRLLAAADSWTAAG